jgi:hypothetical protein
MNELNDERRESHAEARRRGERRVETGPPELYQVVIECRDEAEQRELFERLRGEQRRVKLLVL